MICNKETLDYLYLTLPKFENLTFDYIFKSGYGDDFFAVLIPTNKNDYYLCGYTNNTTDKLKECTPILIPIGIGDKSIFSFQVDKSCHINPKSNDNEMLAIIGNASLIPENCFRFITYFTHLLPIFDDDSIDFKFVGDEIYEIFLTNLKLSRSSVPYHSLISVANNYN